MAYTFDITSTVGKLRLLVQDMDLSSVLLTTPLEQRSAMFTDEDLLVFLDLKAGDLLMAAALGLRTRAANPQLLVQSRANGKARVDYGNARADLIRMAKEYEEQAMSVPADAVVEQNYNDFTHRQILDNAAMRQEI